MEKVYRLLTHNPVNNILTRLSYYYVKSNDALSMAFCFVAILLPLLNAFNTYSALLNGKKMFKTGFFYNQISNTAYYGAMIVALMFVHQAIYLVFVNLAVNTVMMALLYALTLKNHVHNEKESKDAISYGAHVSAISFFSTIASKVDNIIVYHYVGVTELAIYAFASLMPERLSGIIKSISTAAFPKFSNMSLSAIKKTIISKTLRLLLFSLFLSLTYYFVAPFLFRIFFPQYMASVLYSQIYSFATALSISATLATGALYATKAKRELYIYNLINPLFQISILTFLGSLYGTWGVLAARIIASMWMIMLAISLIFLRRETNPQE